MIACEWGGGFGCAQPAATRTDVRLPHGLWRRFLCETHRDAWTAAVDALRAAHGKRPVSPVDRPATGVAA